MSMSKTGYADATIGTTSTKINITTGGNIAQDGDPVTGTKYFSLKGVRAENTKTQNNEVARVFIEEIAGGSFTDKSMTIEWGVE